jgi:DNA-binding LacI/PurR family transcriptional regulator
MAVTAKDVAREAGVSQATVSYVINDNPHQRISPETRRRVLDAVAHLGYAPSAAARALRRGSTDVVLLVLPDVPLGPVVAHLIEQLTDELEPFGLSLVARRNRGDSRLSRLWRELRPIAVVGVVDLPPGAEEEMRAAGIAVVNTALSPKGDDATTAVPQNIVGRMQLEHLAFRGHRRIGYAAPDDSRVNAFYALRLEGVRQACLELGLDQPDVQQVHLTGEDGERVVRAWTAGDEPVTGVCAYHDETARGGWRCGFLTTSRSSVWTTSRWPPSPHRPSPRWTRTSTQSRRILRARWPMPCSAPRCRGPSTRMR